MSQTQAMPGAQQSGAMNIDQLQEVAINVVQNFCGIIAMPVEIILRPHYGTRYYPVPVTFFACVLMILMPLFSAMATGIVNMIPFSHAQAPIGLFGIGSLSQLFFLLLLIHGIRLYRRMLDMSRELSSEFEGPPLPFFQLIPGTQSFWRTRIVIEPAMVFITATILGRFFIFQSGLVTYLQIAALMLTMKSFIAWFRQWEYFRKLMDIKFAGPIIAKMVENRATEDEMATVHLASFPQNLSPDLREAAVSHIARAYAVPAESSNAAH
jgi:hypothetical protein